MKKLYILSYLLYFIFSCSFAQTTFETLIKNNNDEYVFDIQELDSAYFLCGKSKDANTNLFTPLLIKISNSGTVIKRLVFDNHLMDFQKGLLLKAASGNFIFYGYAYKTLPYSKRIYIFFAEFNSELDTIWTSWWPVLTNDEILSFRTVILNNRNFGFFITKRPAESKKKTYLLLYEFSQTGQLVSTKSTRVPHGGKIQNIFVNPDSINTYSLISTDFGSYVQLNILNPELNLMFLKEFITPVRDNITVKKYFDKYYFSGYLHFTLEEKYQFYSAVLDDYLDSLKTSVFGKDDLINDYPALYRSLDFISENSIYFGATTNMVNPPGLIYNNTWFMLHKTDSDLNPLWTKWYGGNAYYEMFCILATNDSGCLMAGNKIDLNTNYLIRNIYLLKVDENGTFTGIDYYHIKQEQLISIYPNPGRNQLTITNNTKNLYFELFDITGKILLKKFIPAYSTEVNVSHLRKGVYFYRIYDNKNIIKTGKWVKQ